MEQIKAKSLLQVSAPYSYVVNHLDFNKIGYDTCYQNPNNCINKQTFIDSDILDYFNSNPVVREKPIFVSMNNEILDGHHRNAHSIIHGKSKPLKSLKIMLGFDDAVDVLTQIEANWGNEKDAINDSSIIVVGYRASELKENSLSGNFLTIQPTSPNDLKFEIKFDKLLKIPQKNVECCSKLKTLFLAKKVCPEIQIRKDAVLKNIPFEIYVNRLAYNFGKSKGYDGILYGDNLLQIID